MAPRYQRGPATEAAAPHPTHTFPVIHHAVLKLSVWDVCTFQKLLHFYWVKHSNKPQTDHVAIEQLFFLMVIASPQNRLSDLKNKTLIT